MINETVILTGLRYADFDMKDARNLFVLSQLAPETVKFLKVKTEFQGRMFIGEGDGMCEKPSERNPQAWSRKLADRWVGNRNTCKL